MIIYLSGPITGVKNYREAFFLGATCLCLAFENEPDLRIINPAHVSDALPPLPYEAYLDMDLALIPYCDAIALMPGWDNSDGCRQENEMAKKHRKTVLVLAMEGQRMFLASKNG